MAYSFQDRENLYLVMDLMSGGDLRYHLSRRKRFSEAETSIPLRVHMVRRRVRRGLPNMWAGVRPQQRHTPSRRQAGKPGLRFRRIYPPHRLRHRPHLAS